jgi:hypothetical protein
VGITLGSRTAETAATLAETGLGMTEGTMVQVLPGSTRFYEVLQGSARFGRVLQGATRFMSDPKNLAEPRRTRQNPVEPWTVRPRVRL